MNTTAANSSSVADLSVQFSAIKQIACSVNLILSFPTNGYVLWLIVTGAGGTMNTDFFRLNLSVSELLFCLFSIFFIVNPYDPTNVVFKFGKFGFGLLYCSRPLFQTCICVERYLAVIHPVTFLKYKPLRYRVGCCSAAWLMGLLFCLLKVFMISAGDTSINNYAYLVLYLIMLPVMLFCCLSVLWALKQPGPGERKREESNNMKMKAFKIILNILVFMVMSYLPLIVILCISDTLTSEMKGYSTSIAFFNIVISGFVQPLLFLHRAGKLTCMRRL